MFWNLPKLIWPEAAEFIWAFSNGFQQAFVSSIFSLVLALWFSQGYVWLQNKFLIFLERRSVSSESRSQRWSLILDISILLPTLLPTLFTVLILISILNPFPLGLIGVTLVHIFLNTGLATLMVVHMVKYKWASTLNFSHIEGATKKFYFISICRLAYRDLLAIFLFIFMISFTSFSVPFMVGGAGGTNLEVLIYEKIRISNDWGQALSLALLQLVLLFLLSLFYRPIQVSRNVQVGLIHLWTSPIAAAGLILFSLFPVIVFIQQSFSSWGSVNRVPGLWEIVLETLSYSILFSISVGMLILLMLLATANYKTNSWVHKLILGFVSPSTALVGFAFLFFLPQTEPWLSAKWILAVTYLFFTTLYRWGWKPTLDLLNQQKQVAETLGANDRDIFFRIVFPQVLPKACQISGLAALWALGDFSIGRILLTEDRTLAMLIQNLTASYRTEAAFALMVLLLGLGLAVYLFFVGVSYVGRLVFEKEI